MRVLVPALAGLVLAVQPFVVRGEEMGARSVLVLSAGEDDARLEDTRRAIAFWNDTLAQMHLPPRFLAPEIVIDSPVARVAETYALRISEDGRRIFPGAVGPPPPPEIIGLRADLVVLLSTQRIQSFAWPMASRRYFIAIRTDRAFPLANPGVSHNVIAHELGHTLGLTHNGTPTMLMCGACATRFDESTFLPLTPEDRERLLNLHSPVP
jgi:hypothetical protein